MDVKQILLESLEKERRLTRETIAAMTDGDVEFKPTPGQMSFGSQALHIAGSWAVFLEGIQGQGWNWEKISSLADYPTLPAILAKLDDVTAAEAAYYKDLEPEAFMRDVHTGWGPPEPLAKLIISFLAHEAHHRGQLVTYLRLKGMTPAQY
ncbi:MAG TPA: DinB family protein [Symbiobacteriaceae bacterium]|jgi:uncharacterized damage-inducible protein DinB